jgi:hypothetical protein
MKIVDSFDLFDTILGKKTNDQTALFNKCMELNKLPNFTEIRIQSEIKAKEKNPFYNLNHIYKYVQNHYKLNYSKLINSISIELTIEAENLYPIYTNINKLTMDSILIIESYFTSEQIKKFLSLFNIIDIPIFTSSELCMSKTDGTIYNYLKKDYKIKLHTGSNYTDDYEIPKKYKIPSIHYTFDTNQNILKLQNKLTIETKNYIKMIENNCKNLEDEIVWNIQLHYNFPILILFSHLLKNYCRDNEINEIIFINRNCIYLKRIFDIVNNSDSSTSLPDSSTSLADSSTSLPNKLKITELSISNKLFENKKYLKYLLLKFNKTSKYLIVDLHHGSKRLLTNFFKISYDISPSFYFIFGDTNQNINSLYNDDPSLSRLIEFLNLTNNGAPIDYANNIVINDKLEYTDKIPAIYNNVINLIENTINPNIINDYHQHFINDYLNNLISLKTKINESVEYEFLKSIYNLTNTYYLKQDYRLGLPSEEIIIRSIINPSIKNLLMKDTNKYENNIITSKKSSNKRSTSKKSR